MFVCRKDSVVTRCREANFKRCAKKHAQESLHYKKILDKYAKYEALDNLPRGRQSMHFTDWQVITPRVWLSVNKTCND